MSDLVHFTIADDGVGLITINRLEAHNAINREVQNTITSILDETETDETIRCLVITGTGGRAFSAGWDIKELVSLPPDDLKTITIDREDWLWRWYTTPLPTIAAIHGLARGVGTYLCAAADLRVGGPSTNFAVTAASYGDAGLTWLLPDLVGTPTTTDILFTGRTVGGKECDDIGFLTRYEESDDNILPAAIKLARQVAILPPAGIQNTKKLLRERAQWSVRERYDQENHLLAAKTSKVTELFSEFLSRKSP